MRLGIIGAMDVEIDILKQHMTDCTEIRHSGTNFYAGQLEGVPVVVAVCGVGKVNAALCAQILCDWFQVTHIINTGIAGSLSVSQDIGDLVVSWDVIHHDFDCTAFGYQRCQIPKLPWSFMANDLLLYYAQMAAQEVHPGHVRTGRVASGDQFISDKHSKEAVLKRTGALCVEMEGAAIAQAAYRNGVPFVIIRAISDKADESAGVDYPSFESLAADRCARVVIALANHLNTHYSN